MKEVAFASLHNLNNIVKFSNQFDIEQMRKHPEYREVKEEEENKPATVSESKTIHLKK